MKKNSPFKEMTAVELAAKGRDLRHEMFNLRLQQASAQLEKPARIRDLRKAIDRAGHPALLMVDAISSLGSVDYRHDEWAVDVTVACSQKGLMLPPGLGLVAISEKALAVSKTNKMPRSYWDWAEMLK